jgi:hypothetical protein
MAAADAICNVMDVTGAAVQFGVPYSWWGRPNIERFNALFEQRTGHRLPSTLGSNPGDTRKDDPVQKALDFDIRIEDIVATFGEFCRDHNLRHAGTPTHGQSIIRIIESKLADPSSGVFAKPLPRFSHEDWTIFAHVRVSTVRGNPGVGRGPYIQIGPCKYHSKTLTPRFDLVGKRVFVLIHRRNANVAIAISMDTYQSLGYLNPERLWLRCPVPLEMRSVLAKFVKRARPRGGSTDPFGAYVEHLQKCSSSENPGQVALELANLKQQHDLMVQVPVPKEASDEKSSFREPPRLSVVQVSRKPAVVPFLAGSRRPNARSGR